eukprot:GAHX01003431.1.p1 GENE.GAHX01003431.1~~GAHX01003431.1.p1  ORF type:complete len:219 (+),score=35.14 GAHX01003431.1:161-817(+)
MNASLPKSDLKIVITSIGFPKSASRQFIKDFLFLIPYSTYYKRQKFHSFDDVVTAAKKNNVTDLFVVNERFRTMRHLLHISFQLNTVSLYRIINYQSVDSIKNAATSEAINSEVIFKGFETDLGKQVEGSLRAMFNKNENIAGRQCVIVKNTDDYIFFRKYKYVFLSNTNVKLQETGPRFTLKIRTFRNSEEEELMYKFNEFSFDKQQKKNYFKDTFL